MNVTINIMSYKYGHLVGNALESVLSQTRVPDVIRVYDDGIGDCKLASERYPDVEFIFRPRNLGIVENFNQALKAVTTERVIYLGADNWLAPEAIEMMMARSEDIVSHDRYITGLGEYQYSKLPWQPHGSAMYDVKKALAVGGYAASGNKHTEEDSVLFKKMFDAGCSFHNIERPLLYYRKHAWNYNDNLN